MSIWSACCRCHMLYFVSSLKPWHHLFDNTTCVQLAVSVFTCSSLLRTYRFTGLRSSIQHTRGEGVYSSAITQVDHHYIVLRSAFGNLEFYMIDWALAGSKFAKRRQTQKYWSCSSIEIACVSHELHIVSWSQLCYVYLMCFIMSSL